jgi:hypothetical protein
MLAWGSQGNGAGQFDEPSSLAFGSDGSVYVTDLALNRVQRFTADGVFVSTSARRAARRASCRRRRGSSWMGTGS